MIENNKIMAKVKYGQTALSCYGYQTLRNGRTIIRKQINTFAAKRATVVEFTVYCQTATTALSEMAELSLESKLTQRQFP